MKKLILLLLFIPLVSLGQEQSTVVGVKSETRIVNKPEPFEPSVNVRVPLNTDLNNFTDILIVDATMYDVCGFGVTNTKMCSKTAEKIEDVLSSSIFNIKNPYSVDKKRAKKDSQFLKTIKKDSYLHLYIRVTRGVGPNMNTSLVLRNSQNNKTIYSATHINIGLEEVLAPLIDY